MPRGDGAGARRHGHGPARTGPVTPRRPDLLAAALERYGRTGDRGARARVLYGIGYVHREQGRGAAGPEAFARALELYRAAADRHGEALDPAGAGPVPPGRGGPWRRPSGCCGAAADSSPASHDTFGVMYTEQSLAKVGAAAGPAGRAARTSRPVPGGGPGAPGPVRRGPGAAHPGRVAPGGRRHRGRPRAAGAGAGAYGRRCACPCGGPAPSGTWPRCGRPTAEEAARPAPKR